MTNLHNISFHHLAKVLQRNLLAALVFGVFAVAGAALTIYAGTEPSDGFGQDGALNATASMHPFDQIATKAVDGFDRDTDSLEAISDKIDEIVGNG